MTVTNVHQSIVDVLVSTMTPQYDSTSRTQAITYGAAISVGEAILGLDETPKETITTRKWTWSNAGGEDMHLIITIETASEPLVVLDQEVLWIEHDEITVKFGGSYVAVPYFNLRAIDLVDDETTLASLKALITGGRQ